MPEELLKVIYTGTAIGKVKIEARYRKNKSIVESPYQTLQNTAKISPKIRLI